VRRRASRFVAIALCLLRAVSKTNALVQVEVERIEPERL
jgi:hypothetical protein